MPRLLMPRSISRIGAWHVWLTYDGFSPTRIAWCRGDAEAFAFAFRLWGDAPTACSVVLTKERAGNVTRRVLIASSVGVTIGQ